MDRIIAVIISLTMCLTMAAPAFAEEGQTVSTNEGQTGTADEYQTTIDGKKWYGSWSKIKSIRTKK